MVDVKYIFTYIKDAMATGSTAIAELPRDALQVGRYASLPTIHTVYTKGTDAPLPLSSAEGSTR